MNLKRTITFGALVAFLFSMVTPVVSVQAAGGMPEWPAITLTANKTSAATNDAITVTARFFLYECNTINQGTGKPVTKGMPEDCNENFGGASGKTTDYPHACPLPDEITATVVTTGDAVTTSKATVCGIGTDTFTVKSSAAGAKTVKIALTSKFDGEALRSSTNTLSLSFTAPVAAKPKPAPAPAPAPAPVVEKPAAPTVATITAGGEEVKATDPVSITTSEPLVLSGKTVPNGKVAVYVFSDPKLFETTADAEGNWTVKVEGLPEGNHHAEVEVTNPANNQKSDRTKLLEFSVVADKKMSPMPVEQTSSKTGLWLGIAAAALVLGAIVGFLLWKRKQKKAKSNDDFSNPNPPVENPSDPDVPDVSSPDAPSSSSDSSSSPQDER